MQSLNWQSQVLSKSREEGQKAKVGQTHTHSFNLLMRSARVRSLLRRYPQQQYPPSLVRNPSSAEADSDVFTLENWATLYKQQIIITSFDAH